MERKKEEGMRGVPLADRMRPRSLDEFVGQKELVGEKAFLRSLIKQDKLCSMIFWGPPGCGKTALARIIASSTKAEFVALSAVTSGIKDVKAIIERARINLRTQNRRTILFIDEIHRFNKAQQDAFLPHVEAGTIILIGATTENPSFSVIAPLLSRCRVFVFKRLSDEELKLILHRALKDEERAQWGVEVDVSETTLDLIIHLSDGDARRALNLLELSVEAVKARQGIQQGKVIVTPEVVKEVSQRQQLLYDKMGEEHYNLISAFHKSLRGSDPDAALYWMVRMLEAGEDPLYIARRMIRFASEDVGNADPQALVVALAARDAYDSLGSPEGELALAQAALYLATAPKSNAVYKAYEDVRDEVQATGALPVPFVIRNAPTSLMKALGYGKGYLYDHDFADHYAPQEYFPEGVRRRKFYEPTGFGFEREIQRRIKWWEEKKKEFLKRMRQEKATKNSATRKSATRKSATKSEESS
ncbi:replication-associated recombination protein A [Candidatus Sumerlaeota bacterium]|nr:replication-associated recombination protein A [Candidatus Sumerlaeota bacterium]